jgi:hypothetical protein
MLDTIPIGIASAAVITDIAKVAVEAGGTRLAVFPRTTAMTMVLLQSLDLGTLVYLRQRWG